MIKLDEPYHAASGHFLKPGNFLLACEKAGLEKKQKKALSEQGPLYGLIEDPPNWCPGPESNRYTISGERF